MNRLDKADDNNKTQMMKLQAEFSAELQNLGFRLDNLEKSQQNIKWTGDGRIRMLNSGDSVLNSLDKTADQYIQERFRLFITAKFDDNVEAHG